MRDEDQKIMELVNDPVSKLLGGLKRVEAPGDFDFRVKARIASGRPVDRNKSWLPAAVRFAVPLGLLLLIGAFFGYKALYPPSNIAFAPVVEKQPADVALVAEAPPKEIVSVPADQIIAKSLETEPAGSVTKITSRQNEKRIVSSEPSSRPPGAGSVVRSVGISKTLNMTAKDVLSFIGIEDDASWKVGSVKQNSMADRSGLKAGDVVEAINDQNLVDKSTFGSKFRSKSLRVNRDGKSIQIDLKP